MFSALGRPVLFWPPVLPSVISYSVVGESFHFGSALQVASTAQVLFSAGWTAAGYPLVRKSIDFFEAMMMWCYRCCTVSERRPQIAVSCLFKTFPAQSLCNRLLWDMKVASAAWALPYDIWPMPWVITVNDTAYNKHVQGFLGLFNLNAFQASCILYLSIPP